VKTSWIFTADLITNKKRKFRKLALSRDSSDHQIKCTEDFRMKINLNVIVFCTSLDISRLVAKGTSAARKVSPVA
jgi:hypothetical protein